VLNLLTEDNSRSAAGRDAGAAPAHGRRARRYWLGWASIVTVLAGLALDVAVRHRWLLVALHTRRRRREHSCDGRAVQDWLAERRGRLLLDLWCGGLIAFVALLVVDGGSSFALLLFLAIPFHRSRASRLAARLLARGQCGNVRSHSLALPLSPGATAMRIVLVAAVATLRFC